jgi:leader peptidase (prepilin peptidase) / N-methyltransferase
LSSQASSLRMHHVTRPVLRDAAFVSAFILLTGVAVARFGLTTEFAFKVFVIGVLVVLSRADLDRRLIPNRIVLPAWGVALTANLTLHPADWRVWVGAGGGACLFFFCLALASPSGMGMGDVKLAGFLGTALGAQIVPGIILAMLGSLVFAIAILIHEGWAGRDRTFAYGPFLAAGAIAVLLAS